LFKFKSKIPDFERGKMKILTAGIHASISRINPPKFGGGLKSESDAETGKKGTFYKGLSVDVHIHVMTHTIPDTFWITFPAVVVLTVNKVVFVVNSLLFTHPRTTVRTVNILNIFFFHEKLDYPSRLMGLCIGSP